MDLDLNRYSNENCYLYGQLELDNEWLCDTLEFGDSNCLPDGRYLIKIDTDKQRNERIMIITDFNNNVISKFVRVNTEYYNNIKIRINNSHISIGTKSKNPLLSMAEFQTKLMLNRVSAANWVRENVFLNIKTNENVIIEK